MQQSRIGEGSVESGSASVNERRTSSTVLLDPTVVSLHPQLQPMVLQLQSRAQQLLDIGISLSIETEPSCTSLMQLTDVDVSFEVTAPNVLLLSILHLFSKLMPSIASPLLYAMVLLVCCTSATVLAKMQHSLQAEKAFTQSSWRAALHVATSAHTEVPALALSALCITTGSWTSNHLCM